MQAWWRVRPRASLAAKPYLAGRRAQGDLVIPAGEATPMESVSLDGYRSVMAEMGYRPGNLQFAMARLFEGVPLVGRSVLDIGAGDGQACFYAAAVGARRVVGLEPEAAGAAGGVAERFERTRARLRAEQVELRTETLQAFEAGAERFDVLVSRASINHLNEPACMRLGHDPGAREEYVAIFRKLARLARPGGQIVITDVARRNLFAALGIPNPLARSIEWEKHQAPELWADLLGQARFVEPHIEWLGLNSLREAGRRLLGNRVCAYMTTSSFRLRMRLS